MKVGFENKSFEPKAPGTMIKKSSLVIKTFGTINPRNRESTSRNVISDRGLSGFSSSQMNRPGPSVEGTEQGGSTGRGLCQEQLDMLAVYVAEQAAIQAAITAKNPPSRNKFEAYTYVMRDKNGDEVPADQNSCMAMFSQPEDALGSGDSPGRRGDAENLTGRKDKRREVARRLDFENYHLVPTHQ